LTAIERSTAPPPHGKVPVGTVPPKTPSPSTLAVSVKVNTVCTLVHAPDNFQVFEYAVSLDCHACSPISHYYSAMIVQYTGQVVEMQIAILVPMEDPSPYLHG